MILEFSYEAENDLEQIADYIAQDNPRRALSFVRELRSKCEDLVDNPNGFALVPGYEHHGIRRRVHGNYLIFYRVESVKVVIIHVVHGATDYGAILFGD
ncbi:type II toxin-antitoxin system RelE/ParE family toxin [Rhizobium calliandrae]|uniref:Type II toxin-antitoxin system RelE/ParE family toxin n=1 Tax=Rhizobium calliandrae TaxID=1312182 RepID=A0ABT7KCJ7_9HYPH|nr:type II toxin-antitoxin system RelE/ParE family toxin [Rhizobium calliandrae]MDL2406196.1 type II toxin-antitoxin system RelE/ParE family toxin [Rhizobium calliandrae]